MGFLLNRLRIEFVCSDAIFARVEGLISSKHVENLSYTTVHVSVQNHSVKNIV